MSIRVLLVDDQELVRAGLRVILEAREDLEVVGEAADGGQVADLVAATRPDVVLMDVRMPTMDGIAATRALAAAGSPARVIVLTTFDVDDHVLAALRAGASGFLLKDVRPDELASAIRVVAAGEASLAPSVARQLVDHIAAAPPAAPASTPGATLSAREVDVLRLVARGMSNGEVAARLVVGEATVKTHVSSILRKLGLRDRVQAVVWAYDSGLVTPPTPSGA